MKTTNRCVVRLFYPQHQGPYCRRPSRMVKLDTTSYLFCQAHTIFSRSALRIDQKGGVVRSQLTRNMTSSWSRLCPLRNLNLRAPRPCQKWTTVALVNAGDAIHRGVAAQLGKRRPPEKSHVKIPHRIGDIFAPNMARLRVLQKRSRSGRLSDGKGSLSIKAPQKPV